MFKEKEDETLAERSRLLSLEEATLARQERKKVLFAQMTSLENDKQSVCNEKKKIEEEVNTLESSNHKYNGVLFVFLCIITVGLYFIFSKNREKNLSEKIEQLKKSICELEEKNSNINDKITIVKSQIDEIDDSNNAANQNRLADLKSLLKKTEQELIEPLAPFNCTTKDYNESYHEIKENYNELKALRAALKENQGKMDEFLKGKDLSKLLVKIEADITVEELTKKKEELDKERLQCIKAILIWRAV